MNLMNRHQWPFPLKLLVTVVFVVTMPIWIIVAPFVVVLWLAYAIWFDD